MYFDFETSTGTTSQNHLEDVEMDQMFYSLIFAFHLKLQLDGKVIIRSFNHSLEKVNDVSYLTDEMLQNLDPIIARQLKFNCDILKKLSSKKAARRFLEFYTYWKKWWKKQNPIELWETKCYICDFELTVGCSGFASKKITYFDFKLR